MGRSVTAFCALALLLLANGVRAWYGSYGYGGAYGALGSYGSYGGLGGYGGFGGYGGYGYGGACVAGQAAVWPFVGCVCSMGVWQCGGGGYGVPFGYGVLRRGMNSPGGARAVPAPPAKREDGARGEQ